MILTTYKYIVNGYLKLSFILKKIGVKFNRFTAFLVSFSFNYFSLTKLFFGMHFGMSNTCLPISALKIRV
ncbi:hypothetical protein EGM88_07510 [Aureibaculum marinum]|uniref:Uncharacterized protein n=1 Tax=Aureibaculum marinum TaxID=2487930 RepID=A0A3N4NNZ5_9FLAO|nr:hypothetical protein EGM88_07510 [Aureibaculum marinum]